MTASDTAALVLPIEPTHLRALKSADSIVFRLSKGQATIEANRDAANSPDGFDHQTVIYADATLTDYGSDGHDYTPGKLTVNDVAGFHMEHSGIRWNSTGELATIIGRMAKGDTVTLAWIRGNDNDNNRSVGWSRDELRMILTKPSGRTETYLVEVYVGPDNSARMITRQY